MGYGPLLRAQVMNAIGMQFARKRHKPSLDLFGIEPGPARLIEEGEVIDHNADVLIERQALKLSPHEQELAAFGFLTLNPPP